MVRLIITCVTTILVTLIVMTAVPGDSPPAVYITMYISIGLGLAVGGRYIATAIRSRGEMAAGDKNRELAEEFRRLTDMAITSQEHAEMKLGDISVRVEHLSQQITELQKILKEVE